MVEVTLQNLPEGVKEANVQAWYFEEGDALVKGDEIVEVSTDEGTVTLVAPASGILSEVYYDEGETVAVGEVLCLIEEEEKEGPGEAGVKEEGEEE